MSRVIPEVTAALLQAFADAWNRHDVDALMSFMTEDCVFETSAGPDICGSRYAGRDAVRTGFAEVFTTMVLAWKSMVAICSRFETARSR